MRAAIDIDLDQPVVLGVKVSVHACSTCGRMFRAQPPFLRPRAMYTRRVVQKAVESVHCDGLAARCVPERLARDFWVKPSEKMVRLWCGAFAAEVNFTADYQPWVVANFSGILCVDEIYQGELALLLAVDPLAPDGDRLVGYTLLSNAKAIDQKAIKAFLEQLRAAGIQPDEVITDDSPLYPSALAEIWPLAAHQLCLFHATRRVVRAVSDVVKQIRRSIPVPPPGSVPSLHGRLRDKPPTIDEHDGDSERYRWRLARRTLGIAQAHALRQHISSVRAISRQLGVNRRTIEKWLKLAPPDPRLAAELVAAAELPAGEPYGGRLRRTDELAAFFDAIASDLDDGVDTLVITHAQNLRSALPWIGNSRIELDTFARIDISRYPGLRHARLRTNVEHETPEYFGIADDEVAVGLPSGVWLFNGSDRLYGSTARKPVTSKLSPSLSKLGSYVNRAGTFDRKPSTHAWNPQLVEIAISALQPRDVRPQHVAALVHELRSIAIHHTEPLTLPLPCHLAQQTAEYLLPIEEDEDER
jgi:hypothetical protein